MKMMCVIPSRLRSTRLPQKALLPVQGIPMIQRTFENARRADIFEKVIVATDSEKIAEVIHAIGGETMMTPTHISNGSERVANVAEAHPDYEVVVNLQGDEPFVKPSMLKELVAPYLSGEMPVMTTLAYPLKKEKYKSAGAVKVVTDIHHNAIYFSRAPIPYFRTEECIPPVYNHIGLYAYTHTFLMHYQTLSPTPLELTESLEQLRVLENGFKIRVCLTHEMTLEINTPEEYEQAQLFLAS